MASISDFTPDPPIEPTDTPRPSKVQDASRKWCPLCRMYVPRTMFAKRNDARDGLYSYCRPCQNAKDQTAKSRARAYERHIKRAYNLTSDQFNTMLEQQGNACAVCGGPPAMGQNWHVDHDHESGAVRGILCASCNVALGSMRNDPARLRAAADYLEKHGK